MKILVAIAVLIISADASAGILRACEARTSAAFPAYKLAPGHDPRPAPGYRPSNAYSNARGDYDGDGKVDIALLLQPVSGSGKYAISVCLSSKPHRSPELIPNAYTSGPLSTTQKGHKYYDFNTETEDRYELDGIGSYCCECCGATYIFRNGRFVEVIDSD